MRRVPLAVVLVIFALTSAALAAPVVTITTPTGGTTAGSPVTVSATATSSSAIWLMQIYVDGTKKYEVKAASLNTSLTLTDGSHRITVQAYDSSSTGKSSVSITVSTTITKLFSDIEQLTGWESCDVCSGPGGDGAVTPHLMTQAIGSPSLDGKSAEFFLGGTSPYASALWWKQLGADDSVKNFVYDLYFYMKNPSVAQALEFDVNQTLNGSMYIFGTECNLKGTKTWRVYDYVDKWVDTGIPCAVPTAYTWYHLVWEFARTSDGKMRFIAVTLNGKKSYVEQYHVPRPKTTRELNVAFQMDGNSTMTDYNVWLDKVTLKVW